MSQQATEPDSGLTRQELVDVRWALMAYMHLLAHNDMIPEIQRLLDRVDSILNKLDENLLPWEE